ncbi:glutamate 5-kinase [Thermodesulfovibrio yellowstonii]|uniref:Glutamate 5-kinase n=1 Tax=Thermodesulfovibrio yellowstonii TaxID=28262 RepID=A0A9W6GI53_9BACT|nr:glutamate 5-kinase [Thermodesulfovibrio islandicus]GLI54201.1 glutamate 5-kinase [Thermodesulfovibrio islandicus]
MRIVVKIGSNLLTDKAGRINQKRIFSLAKEVSELHNKSIEVVMVSSGAIASGLRKLGLKTKPREIRKKQATAAVGQPLLMWMYERSFLQYKKHIAQILLTRDDLSDRIRYVNAKNTILTLLEMDVIPIINENDTVATDEIKFGDNDQLAALVSGLIEANHLIILSDVEGLYTSDPKKDPDAKIIKHVKEVSKELIEIAKPTSTGYGTGGMYSKVMAAKKATSFGIPVHIVSGRRYGNIKAVIEGKQIGTYFEPIAQKVTSRKGWIAYATRAKGNLYIDEGAVKALLKNGKSLLPSGIKKVEGDFDVGDAVYCIDEKGERIAKGLVNYSSCEIKLIKGKKSSEIEKILGYKYADEIVHRDNLVILV